MNPQIDILAARTAHEPGTRTSDLLGEWHAARDEARETSHALTMAAATRDRGRGLRSSLVNTLTTALVEILGNLQDKAAEHASNCEHALAAALLESGPVLHGTDRYEGMDVGGGMLCVYRRPVDFRPDRDIGRDGAHAATAIDDETS